MARFNKKGSVRNKTVNLAGGEAFKQTDKVKLVSILLTSFVQDQYYRSAKGGLKSVAKLIDKIPDKKFVAKAAIYARNEFGMRSISHAVAGEVAARVKGEEWTKNFYDKVVHRPDDITEILAYYLDNYKKPLPNSLKKGLGLAFGKFDEYQLAKYRGEGHDLSLVDAVNLLHPKPNKDNKGALKKLIEGTLKSFDTWETGLTEAGKAAKTEEEKEELKAKAWKKLIKEKKIGYFALLRNLRNILDQAPDMVDAATELLVDEKLIRKSLVLPFRFSTAIEQIEEMEMPNTGDGRKVLTALNGAIEISLSNVPKLKGSTLVVLDESGSMDGRPHQIGGLFAAVLVKANNADLILFSDEARYKNLNPADSLLTLANQITRDRHSGGTNFHSIFETANKAYDRIIILSDMQGWVGYDAPTKTFNDYKKRSGANPMVFSFDLQGYGTLQLAKENVYEIAGFSEKVFDIIKLLEEDKNALVSKIEALEL